MLRHAPEVVFDFLCDPRNRPLWQSSLASVEVPDAPPGVGLRWRERTVVLVRPRLVVTEHQRPTAWAEEGRWRGISATLRLDLAPHGQGTVLRATGAVEGRGLWRLPAALAGRLAGLAIAADLRKAGRVLTARGGQH